MSNSQPSIANPPIDAGGLRRIARRALDGATEAERLGLSGGERRKELPEYRSRANDIIRTIPRLLNAAASRGKYMQDVMQLSFVESAELTEANTDWLDNYEHNSFPPFLGAAKLVAEYLKGQHILVLARAENQPDRSSWTMVADWGDHTP